MQHGLISRTIDDDGSDTVLVTEIWDHRNPKCPVIIYDRTVWPWVKRADVVEVKYIRRVPKHAITGLDVSRPKLNQGAE